MPSDVVYENPWFRVVKEGPMHWIHEPKAASGAIVVVKSGDSVLMMCRERPALGNITTVEFPRGYGRDGMTSEELARTLARNLLTEDGAKDMTCQPIGKLSLNTGTSSSQVPAFLVNVSNVSKQDLSPGSILLSPEQVREKVAQGQIHCAITLAALAMATAVK